MANVRYTKEMIQEAANRSFTWAETCRQLGIKPSTGSQSHLNKRAQKLNIDFSHFYSKSEASSKLNRSKPKDISEYLKKDSPLVNSHFLKVKLIKSGLKKYQCEACSGTEWRGQMIPLELHHADGDRCNNTLENLQILCANCHSVTPNYSGKKNRGVAKRKRSSLRNYRRKS